jgi:hypothetical protein
MRWVPLLALAFAPLAIGQWPATARANLEGPAPKTAEGRPDLSGLWENDGQAVSVGAAGVGFLDLRRAVPSDAMVMKPEAAALRATRFASNSKDHPDAHCLPLHPVQLHSHPQPQKIIQTPDLIVLLHEANSGQRLIFLDGRALPPADAQPWWYGYSVGRWEGDTLVVTTRGFRDGGWLDEQGTPSSDALTLTERFRRPSYGKLDIEITVDDPKTFEKPFTFQTPHRLRSGEELIEFICLENQHLEHMVGR